MSVLTFETVLGKVPTTNSAVNSLLIPAGACVAGGVVAALIMKKIKSKSSGHDERPQKWVKVGQITELNIYPVKGMPGTSVEEAQLGRLGFKATNNPYLRDRTFIIVNEKGQKVSLGKFPILALTRVTVKEEGKLHFSFVKDPTKDIEIDIPTNLEPDMFKSVNLYGEVLKGLDCGDKVSAWLASVTGANDLRLLYHALDEPQRGMVSRNKKFPTYRNEHTGAFQDETSYMLMTEETLAVVNAELTKPVTHANFRPTIVVKGIPEPFAEDFWGFVKIGKEADAPVLKASLPCARCTTTTVDPDTGDFREDGEPLKTIYKLKRPVGDARITKLVSKSAILGSHFGIFDGALDKVVRVGDPIYAALL